MIVQQQPQRGMGAVGVWEDVETQQRLENLRNLLIASLVMATCVYLGVSGKYDPRNW